MLKELNFYLKNKDLFIIFNHSNCVSDQYVICYIEPEFSILFRESVTDKFRGGL